MTLPATAFAELQPTAGSDTNGGMFDPNLTGCTPATDLAVVSGGTSSSPVVSSASYNFVAGDVGHWLFISAGTNFNPGWYKISSVASNQATLDAAVGHVFLYNGLTYYNSTAGLGTGTSGGTWTIDYSQTATARFALTGQSSSTTTLTTTSATKAWVGNIIYISGTGLTTGRYLVTAVTAGTSATLDRSPGTTGSAVVVNVGGAFLTIGEVNTSARGIVGGNSLWVKNTGTMSISSSPATGPAGSNGNNPTLYAGYNSLRGDLDFTVYDFSNHPTFQATAGVNALTLGANSFVRNIIFDAGTGATKGAVAINILTQGMTVTNCKITGPWTTRGITSDGQAVVNRCYVTGCNASGGAIDVLAAGGTIIVATIITGNTCAGINSAGDIYAIDCIIDSNSGASSDGIVTSVGRVMVRNCTIRNNGRDGVRLPASETYVHIQNNIITENAGFGVNFQAQADALSVAFNAYWSNTSGDLSNSVGYSPSDVILTGSPYTNTSTGDFSLNSTAGAGAACKAAGYPGTFPGGVTVGHADMGAVQSAAAGGGGSVLRSPLMVTYVNVPDPNF